MHTLTRPVFSHGRTPTRDYIHSAGCGSHQQVLYAAAWIVGEFATSLSEPLAVLEALLQPRVAALPGLLGCVVV